jgi:hypothetical protein
MSLSVNILPVFEQLGLYDELQAISFHHSDTSIMYDNMKVIYSFPNANQTDEYVYPFFCYR